MVRKWSDGETQRMESEKGEDAINSFIELNKNIVEWVLMRDLECGFKIFSWI